MLEALTYVDFAGRVIIAQAEVGRPELADGLRERGVDVQVLAAYRNVMPELSAGVVVEALKADVVVFASPSAVTRYIEHVSLSPVRAVCIGSVTSGEADAAGFDVATADSPTTEAIVAELVTLAQR